MKKTTRLLIISILALIMLVGCSGKGSNSTPLTPVYANGVAPKYDTAEPDESTIPDTAAPEVTTAPADTTAPEEVTPTEPVSDDKLYSDNYISFNYPSSFVEILPLYIRDKTSASSILVSEQAIDNSNSGFLINAYSDVTVESFNEIYATIIGNTELATDIKVTKTLKNEHEITSVQYYEKNEDEAAGASYRNGIAYVYVEKNADPDFDEIIITVSANEYTADTIPDGHVNFTEIVSKIVSTISVK